VSPATTHVELRPAGAADQEFFAGVYASTRSAELAAVPFTPDQRDAFLAQQFEAQSAHYARHYGDASYDVVLVDGTRAGRLIVWRRPDAILIVDIALLPEFRGQGAGGRLLAAILAEAEDAGCPVTIHVERSNRALGLYLRLGFVPVDEADGIYLLLERQPKAAS
jgi:ribosomal protein S18 acetylase RimI-like enzyme